MNLKEIMLMHENNLSSDAVKSSDAIRLKDENDDIRPAFFRDVDRIIHSHAYTRYINKTQVFSFNKNDHVTTRMVHVQLVSKLARTIGRALKLNEDLIEAIALGHDLGHVPFGHPGEYILNDISLKYTGKYFNHNVQSVRQLMYIENNGEGSNLTIQVLDGILCHNGEFCQNNYYPKKKSIDDFLNDFNNTYVDSDGVKKLVPMTLEGCVVRISDVVGYIGRDLEDAMMLGLIKKEDIPVNVSQILGTNNKQIVNTLILDIINNSLNKNYISMSKKVFDALVELKNFNYKQIYAKANSKEQLAKYKEMFEFLFKLYLDDLKNNTKKTDIYKHFLDNMNSNYLNNNSDEDKVIDFIAGMTDDYFIKEYNKYIEK